MPVQAPRNRRYVAGSLVRLGAVPGFHNPLAQNSNLTFRDFGFHVSVNFALTVLIHHGYKEDGAER